MRVCELASTRATEQRRGARGGAVPALRPVASASGDVEQLLADGVEYGLHARVQLELLQDVPDVVLDRVLGDEQLAGDLTVVPATGDETQYVEFALGQARGRHAVGAAGLLLDQRRELVEELRRHRGADQR